MSFSKSTYNKNWILSKFKLKTCLSCYRKLPTDRFLKKGDGFKDTCKFCEKGLRKSNFAIRLQKIQEKREKELEENVRECVKCKVKKPFSDYYQRDKTLFRTECKDCLKKAAREHRKNNKEYKDAQKLNARIRYHNGKKYQIEKNLRGNLYKALKGETKKGSAVRDLGYSIGEFKLYIEHYFPLYPGMSWNNYGTEWHLDHFLPLSSFDLTDRTQLQEVCHWTNLQPLWKFDNLSKGPKGPDQREIRDTIKG